MSEQLCMGVEMEEYEYMIWNKIDGINFWKINRMFNKLAFSRTYLEEKIKNGVLVIPIAPKKTRELTHYSTKCEIEEKVRKSEGFEVFRICLLEECNPVYKEKLTITGVSRWLEIPLKYS